MKVFEINGYYEEDKQEVSGLLVAEFDNTPKGYSDEQIFFYGISEENIKTCIKDKQDIGGVIPESYEVVDEA